MITGGPLLGWPGGRRAAGRPLRSPAALPAPAQASLESSPQDPLEGPPSIWRSWAG